MTASLKQSDSHVGFLPLVISDGQILSGGHADYVTIQKNAGKTKLIFKKSMLPHQVFDLKILVDSELTNHIILEVEVQKDVLAQFSYEVQQLNNLPQSLNLVFDVHLQPRSTLNWLEYILPSLALDLNIQDTTYLDSDATLKRLSLDLGGQKHQHTAKIFLNEPQANVLWNGLFVGQMGQTIFDTTLTHRAAHTTSFQDFKGLAQNVAKFTGRLHITENADKASTRLINKNLLLHPDAKVYTKPELKIATNDVVCSHGATVGEFVEEELFYLCSRGLSPREAKSILAQAFVRHLWQDWPHESQKVSLAKNVERDLAGLFL